MGPSRVKYIFIAICLGTTLSACTTEKNSLSAHAKCIENKTSNGLSKDVARGLCSLEHQNIVHVSSSDMTASLRPNSDRLLGAIFKDSFIFQTHYGNLLNSTGKPFVITSISAEVTINQKSKILNWEDLWIEPSKGESLERYIDFSEFDLNHGEIPQKGQWSWRLLHFKGLIID